MTDEGAGSSAEDSGPTANQFLGAAWLLAFASAGSLLRLLDYTAGDGPARLQIEHLIWATCCVIAALFSASCAVLVGIKRAEQRLGRLAQKQDANNTQLETD